MEGVKTVIMYRTALFAQEVGNKLQSSTPEWKSLNNLIEDFNKGEQNSISDNDIDSYALIEDLEFEKNK